MKKVLIIGSIFTALFLVMTRSSRADFEPDFPKLVEAIGNAENSVKYPYGIKSINTHSDKVLAGKICMNTVRNNWKRYTAIDSTPSMDEYMRFLANRFCPVGAVDDLSGLNAHWLGNVSRLYQKGVESEKRRS